MLDKQIYSPIPIDGYDQEYFMNVKTGEIFYTQTDDRGHSFISPVEYINDNGKTYVNLKVKDKPDFTASLGDLVIRVIYGNTHSGPVKPVINTPPLDMLSISPDIYQLEYLDGTPEKSGQYVRTIKINGVLYQRWKDSYYFVSNEGCVFSILMNQFFRFHFTKKGQALISTLYDGYKKSTRVSRMVYEVYIGDVPPELEIVNVNGKIWDNTANNLKLMSHAEHMSIVNPDSYKLSNADILRKVVEASNEGKTAKEIAEEFDVPVESIWKLRQGIIYVDKLDELELSFAPSKKDRKFTPDQIKEIRKRYNEGETIKSLSKANTVSIQCIYGIVRNKTYTDVK